MADTKISAYAALAAAPAAGDYFMVVDISDTSMAATGTTKKVTAADVFSVPAFALVDDGSGLVDLDTHRAEGQMPVFYIADQTDQAGVGMSLEGTFALGAELPTLDPLEPSDGQDHEGKYSTVVGIEANFFNTAGNSNNVIGYRAMNQNDAGTDNTAVGRNALYSQAGSSDKNSAFGSLALYNSAVGTLNTAIGYKALYGVAGQSPQHNTALGHECMLSVTSANNDVAFGYQAMRSNTSGSTAVALGYQALYTNTTASFNVAVGHQALFASTAAGNSALGSRAGYAPAGLTANASTTGTRNTWIGFETGPSAAPNPSDGTAVGYQALALVNGTALGSGAQANASTATAIGKGVVTAVANQVALGTSAEHVLLKTAAAPADASFAASQFSMWLDPTNGAAKLMFKAKQADGTVKTGSVTLS
jgi:hypothetical protein